MTSRFDNPSLSFTTRYLSSKSSLIRPYVESKFLNKLDYTSKNTINSFSEAISRSYAREIESPYSSKRLESLNYNSTCRPLSVHNRVTKSLSVTDSIDSYKKPSYTSPSFNTYRDTFRNGSHRSVSVSVSPSPLTRESSVSNQLCLKKSLYLPNYDSRRSNFRSSGMGGLTTDIDTNTLCNDNLSKLSVNKDESSNSRCNILKSKLVGTFVTTRPSVGMFNLGNTCYMNTVIQCLSNTVHLNGYVLNKTFDKDIRMRQCVLFNDFYGVLLKLWTDTVAVNSLTLKTKFQRLVRGQFNGRGQQDAHEYLRLLLEKLHADINRVHERPPPLPELDSNTSDFLFANQYWSRYLQFENSYIVDLFGGLLKSTLQCTVCDHKSVTFEVFWDISLSIPPSGELTLDSILHSFVGKEILDNDERPVCSICKKQQKMIKSYAFQKLPRYLILHLKRFNSDYGALSPQKLYTLVHYPMNDLDMQPFMAQSTNNTFYKYNLYAVATHRGSLNTGHFVAYCQHPRTESWYCYDDDSVTPVSSTQVQSYNAYLLFYESVH